jgi:hypothetical protein
MKMKFKYLICSTIVWAFNFVLIFSVLCFAQENEKAIKVEKYVNTLKAYQSGMKYRDFDKMDDHNFKLILKEMYEAKEIAPEELNKIFARDHERWVKEDTANKNDLLKSVKYGILEQQILDQAKKRYPILIYILLRIPVFIRAKILSSELVYDKNGFPKYVLKLKPEQIIKGKVPIITKDEFEVYYRNYEGVPQSRDYKIGKSYLFLLWDRNELANPGLSVATWVDGHGSRFLITNNILHDEYNIFNMGKEVNWNLFVKKINDMIYKITNSKEY